MIACDEEAGSVPDGAPAWTPEQLGAIERRRGDLLLDAGAGSGKTSVLVERFVRTVLEDDVPVEAILTITFTEKAAAEMRDRIRRRLRELGADAAARATEGAFISTIHGFCARALRTHALAAGIDPLFVVLDAPDAEALADAAFDEALEDLAQNAPGGVDLIAGYSPGMLRSGIIATHAELRSRGELEPALPPLPPLDEDELPAARDALLDAAAVVARELGAVANPSTRVEQALQRLDRCIDQLNSSDEAPWPGSLNAFCLPGGNGAALTTEACAAYGEALSRMRAAAERVWVEEAHALLDRLLRTFGTGYEGRKRQESALDFEDLELLTRELLRSNAELRERYRARFERIMVDELQDTNAVQLELIELLAGDNLFTVGDAQQSIYAFRHADVELFEQRGARLERVGARATLQTNFRSRPEILEVLNPAFEQQLGDHFKPLQPGRPDGPAATDPRVELLVADKGADWAIEGVASPWRIAEARILAARVGELIADGASAREIVVLTRATTDLRAYERALEERGIPTYVIGGRGYWSHPQVVDVVSYLRALANPRDEEALYTVLASPMVAVSVDALVTVAAAGRASGRDPWWVLREPDGRLDELTRRRRPQAGAVRELVRRGAPGGCALRDRAADRPRDGAHRLRPRGTGDAGRAASPGQRPQADAPGPRARGGAGRRVARIPRADRRARRGVEPRRDARERGAGGGRGARRRAADDDPSRQGPRVRDRVRRRPGSRSAVARGPDAGRARRALRPAAGQAGDRQAGAGAALPRARRRAGAGRRHARSGGCSTSR